MAPKKPTVKTKLQQKADKSNKILTGPKGSKPQSTTNTRLMKQGDKTTMSGPARNRPGSGAKASPTPPASKTSPKPYQVSDPWAGPKRASIGNVKGPASSPKRPAQMVNSNSAAMRQIQAKAAASRARAQGQPGIKGPINPPNSARAGQNLIGQGARNLRMAAAGTMSAAQRTMLQAQGAARKAAAQTRRGAKAAMSNMSNTLATRGSVRAGRPVGGPGRGAVGGAIEQVASSALGPLARKAGTKLGNALKPVGRAIDDRLPGINSKDELKRKTAASKAANAKGPKAGPSPKATVTAFSKKTFDQAFKAARTAKASTFTWRGNKYNTKLRGEK